MHECYANFLVGWIETNSNIEDGKEAAMARSSPCSTRSTPTCPHYKTQEWKLEQQILLVSFIGYQWYFSEDPIEFLASEIAFNLPVHVPKIGLPLPLSKCSGSARSTI
jgi:hypothetical protein